MATYPLSITSKGGGKRKVTISGASAEVVAYGDVNYGTVHRKATTLYFDPKKKQPLAVLTPTLQNKRVLTFDIRQADGDPLGSLRVEGGFTTREFEMFDAGGASVARISAEGVGREAAGMVIDVLVGVEVGIGGRASYHVTMQSGATVEITLGEGRNATVEKTNGDLSPEHEQLFLTGLVIWALYVLN